MLQFGQLQIDPGCFNGFTQAPKRITGKVKVLLSRGDFTAFRLGNAKQRQTLCRFRGTRSFFKESTCALGQFRSFLRKIQLEVDRGPLEIA